jgi:hypothetical protein
MNGWYRLWLASCVVAALFIAGVSYPMLVMTDRDSQGDLVRTLLCLWALYCVAMLVLGHMVAWVRRGFTARADG